MFCSICQKWNHNTVDCWNNSANKKRASKEGGGKSDDGMYKDGEVGAA